MSMKDSDSEDGEDLPHFSTELNRMKDKAKGKLDPEDDKMDDEDDNSDTSDELQEAQNNDYPSEFEESEEEKEDFTIRKTDALLVAASTEKDFSNLEVYVYEYKTSSLYVHHDIMLSSYPLCLEWIKELNGKSCNLIAVGTFLPQIEIWNLDLLDAVQPDIILGEVSNLQYDDMGNALPNIKNFQK
jgi:periodic tryptophan protein 1